MKKVIKIISLFAVLAIMLSSMPVYALAEPASPNGLTVSDTGKGYARLEWNDCAGVDYYNVYISANGGTFSLAGNNRSPYFYMSNLAKGFYSYYVTAVYEDYDEETDSYKASESAPSAVASAAVYDKSCVWCSAENDTESNLVTVSWSEYVNSSQTIDAYFDGYIVFMSENGGAYNQIGTVSAATPYRYEDRQAYYSFNAGAIGASPGTYSFAVCKYIAVGSDIYCSYDMTDYDTITVYMPSPTMTTKTKSEVIKWKNYGSPDSYEIWQIKNGKEKLIATVGAEKSSYTVKGVNNYKNDYQYYIKAVKNGTVVFQSEEAYSSDGEARFRAAKKLKKKAKTVKVINTRKKKNSTAWTSSLTKKDKKILADFAKKHFKKGWSDYQKAIYTLEWINKNVSYASGSKYNKIAKCSYVEAIFKKKCGQCLQYNGAYAMMLTYLGYEARIIQGWRGYSMKEKWSHYWCEMKVDGKWYLMETGNYEDSGSWMYFLQNYRCDGRYIMNKKTAK